jgi:tRNA A37 threonylcarbamoyladenosine dehydratase
MRSSALTSIFFLLLWVGEGFLSSPPPRHHRPARLKSPIAEDEEDQQLAGLRFGGISRLFGPSGLALLQRSHVAVVGVGGVGCWTAEALCRSGVGAITLVDLDELCVSNSNRQLHAMTGTVGHAKTTVLAERCRLINPRCVVAEVRDFVTAENVGEVVDKLLLRKDLGGYSEAEGAAQPWPGPEPGPEPGPFALVDAIDGVGDKAALLMACRKRGVPLVAVGGAGGKRDPTRVRTADITCATNDMLLKQVRKLLRREHGFPKDLKGGTKRLQQRRQHGQQQLAHGRQLPPPPEELQPGEPWGVACIYSDEKAEAAVQEGEERLVGCDGAFGTACFVTGNFGFVAAAAAIDLLLLEDQRETLMPAPAAVWTAAKAVGGGRPESLPEPTVASNADGSWEMDCPCSDFDS